MNRRAFFHMNIVSKLIIYIALSLFVVISAWAYYNIKYQKRKLMDHIINDTAKLTETIRLGTHYAMKLNSRDDINQIITNIGKQKGIESINLYNKEGQIKFSNIESEVNRKTDIKAQACNICHESDPPLSNIELDKRTRIINSPKGYRLLGIISPIYNEKGCSTEECHVHPSDKKILGALDVMISLEDRDKEILSVKKGIISLAMLVFVVISATIFIYVHRFINNPIQKLIDGTALIAVGKNRSKIDINQDDEFDQLADAINSMAEEIDEQKSKLNAQRDEYRALFDNAPCMISVQDRDFKLLRFNRQFEDSFHPEKGNYCYQAYKGLDEKCENCPVEKTFKDGKSHYGEESCVGKDGNKNYWIFITSPLKNAEGDVVSAMEMSIDITARKQLEKRLEASEKKYQSIFSHIPNPVFVLDEDTLNVLDCNDSVEFVYGLTKDEVVSKSFLIFFPEEDRNRISEMLKKATILNQIKQINSANKTIYADIWISPSQYGNRNVLLVTTSDITKRLEAEKELIQAGKMATLGEMSTGIAHELNQPLSVIKTASDFILKKMERTEKIEESVFNTLLQKINANIDRASKIINHMRDFARKSDINFERVNVNEILQKAFDIFSQQLKVRGIIVEWSTAENLPEIIADPSRIEQVFINLLVNARDAIEEKSLKKGTRVDSEKIFIETRTEGDEVIIEISDTGIGIKEEIKEKLFEPFFTTKEVGKGTGLGLSISYSIIKESKGHIEVFKNRSKGGATFSIRLPAAIDDGVLF